MAFFVSRNESSDRLLVTERAERISSWKPPRVSVRLLRALQLSSTPVAGDVTALERWGECLDELDVMLQGVESSRSLSEDSFLETKTATQ